MCRINSVEVVKQGSLKVVNTLLYLTKHYFLCLTSVFIAASRQLKNYKIMVACKDKHTEMISRVQLCHYKLQQR